MGEESDGGSFYSVSTRGVFSDFFMQRCLVSVNTKNVVLVVVEVVLYLAIF